MDFLLVLNIIFNIGYVAVGYSITTICFVMAIAAIYYSFVKRIVRTRALSKILEKQDAHTTQRLAGYEREIKQTSAWNAKAYLSSFKQSLGLSKKDYKRIAIFSLIVFVIVFLPCMITTAIEGQKMVQGINPEQLMQSGPVSFILFLVTITIALLSTTLVAFSLPVVLIFYGIVNWRMKKKLTRLEEFA